MRFCLYLLPWWKEVLQNTIGNNRQAKISGSVQHLASSGFALQEIPAISFLAESGSAPHHPSLASSDFALQEIPAIAFLAESGCATHTTLR